MSSASARPERLGIDHLAGRADLVLAFDVVHEFRVARGARTILKTRKVGGRHRNALGRVEERQLEDAG